MFEFKLAKNELLAPLLMVAGAVDKRQSLAILSNILIKADQQQLILTATDLEIEISAYLPCSTSSEEQITVPAKKFIDIVRSLDDDAVAVIKFQESTGVIKAGRSQFKLATLPATDFPAIGQDSAEVELNVPRAQLIHLLQSTHFAMSQNDVRIFLNALLFEFDNNCITTVATDGHRMAICKLPCETSLEQQKLLLPKKGVQEMLRLLNVISDETIALSVGKSHLRLKTDSYLFTSKLIEARFPPYSKAIPRDNDKFVLVDKDHLKKALSRIVILAHEKSKAVLLHIQTSSLTLIANNQEQEEATETIEAQVDGQELKIGINASYLLDVLNFISEQYVRLSLSTTDRSILVESLQDENYQYIIMPMKL